MDIRITIKGLSPLLMHNGQAVLGQGTDDGEIQRITDKPKKSWTEADFAVLQSEECKQALWLDKEGRPTIPTSAIRSCIEQAARKSKEGPSVREGLCIVSSEFIYDVKRYGETLDEIIKNCQHQAKVSVGRSSITRTRAEFDLPWSASFIADIDEELVDKNKLEKWLDIAGRRIGIGDWRPAKSGVHGRFECVSIK